MNIPKKPIINPEDFISNPLVTANFTIIVNKIKLKGAFYKDGEEWLNKEIDFERDESTKLYKNKENRIVIASLKPNAKSLFIWIAFEVECGKDYFWINKDRYMNENNITSINTYKEAIKELVINNIICPSAVKDVYWINPRMLFCGSRINKYSEYVKEYQPKNKSNEKE